MPLAWAERLTNSIRQTASAMARRSFWPRVRRRRRRSSQRQGKHPARLAVQDQKGAAAVLQVGRVDDDGEDQVEGIANIHRRCVGRTQIDAGVTVETGETGEKDRKGAPKLEAKYSLHKFRHFYASWLINRKEDGGLGLPPKMVQERLGHSSINITMDLYGHLFPVDLNHHAELAAAEAALFA